MTRVLKARNVRAGLAAAAGLLLLSSAALADLSNKWRLEFSGDSESTGVLVLRITPKGGTPIDATINVDNSTGENSIAQKVVLGLQAQLPPDAYHVERDDGEDVLIKKQDGAADFSVTIVSSTLEDVRINPDKE
jgi:uncharacterized protein (DUF2141 family)